MEFFQQSLINQALNSGIHYMKIGIITYANVPNFGANLQAFSTVRFLINKGHDPIIIKWEPDDYLLSVNETNKSLQKESHKRFCEEFLPQTESCKNDADICRVITQHKIEAIIIGSDAVLQDFTLLSKIEFPTKRIFNYKHITSEKLFPNAFWGSFYLSLEIRIPMVIMSASSQNAAYQFIHGKKRSDMYRALTHFSYISVRDTWTHTMIRYLSKNKIKSDITPDPVFAFNYNAPEFILSKAEILKKFNLDDKYILVSFRNPKLLPVAWIDEFKKNAEEKGFSCVALPMPSGVNFAHHFEQVIQMPLSPLDWYALIKYSEGYVGQNMHPVVVALHNSVPFYSFDTYGLTKYFKLKCNEKSSKIYHILDEFSLLSNRCTANIRYFKPPTPEFVLNSILNFDRGLCNVNSDRYLNKYLEMMTKILSVFSLSR